MRTASARASTTHKATSRDEAVRSKRRSPAPKVPQLHPASLANLGNQYAQQGDQLRFCAPHSDRTSFPNCNAPQATAEFDEVRDSSTEGENAEPITEEEKFEPFESDELIDGDLTVERVYDGDTEEEQPPTAPCAGFTDRGRTGTVRYGEPPPKEYAHCAQAFTNGGRTGSVVFSGGGGAGPRGNQNAGSVQAQVTPEYDSASVSHGSSSNFEASVRTGTGTADVTRSYVDSPAGDQGNGWYLTAGAAARFGAHERLHIDNTRGHYTRLIDPLLVRRGERRTANTRDGAREALRNYIRWPETITDFQRVDTTDNARGGTVDTADLGSGTYPVDAGPGVVGGTNYQHRVRLPSEPNPT